MIKQFLNEINLNNIFYDKNLYYAHRKEINKNVIFETIFEHSINTLIVSNYLLKQNNYLIIDKINECLFTFKNGILQLTKEQSFEFLINTFFLTILSHDLGKYNPLFQTEKMHQKEIYYNIINNKFLNILDSNHSNYSNIIELLNNYYESFIIKNNIHTNKFLDKFKTQYFLALELLITKHHSGLESLSEIDSNNLYIINEIFNNELTFIIELLYSILIQSDMLATTYFMMEQLNKFDYNDLDKIIKIFDNYLNNKLVKINEQELKSIEYKRDYNKFIYNNLKDFSKSDIENSNSLNELKYKTTSKIITSNNFGDIRIFKGNLGIGKTNISMIYANELSKIETFNKIIYVLPLNTLVDQTNLELQNNFEFKNNKINIVNSEQHISKKDNPNYWSLKYDFENFNNEIVLTTSVNFFEKLIHKNKIEKLSLINLQNSLIIIDEIQLLNDRFFNIIYKYLLLLKDFLNVKILILTATLPIPKKYKEHFENKYILNNEISETIYNHKLLDRVQYNSSKFNENNPSDFISNYIINSNDKNFLIVHNNIRKCNNLYNELLQNTILKTLIYNNKIIVYFYNNTIIKPFLNKILNNIKTNNDKKIIVIATQKIETGVDISFDVGFKFTSSIDNIIQMSGRINRYCLKEKSDVFILKDNIKIYGEKQIRSIVTKDKQNDIDFINKSLLNVDNYYSSLFNKENNDDIENKYKELKFKELDNLKLIENNYIQHIFFIHSLNVKEILNNNDLNLYEKHFKNNYDNLELCKKYKETFFYINQDIKYLFNLFLFKGYVNQDSNFAKTLITSNKEIIKNKVDDIIESFYIINKDSYFYDLEKGLNTNANIDIDDIEDMINSL